MFIGTFLGCNFFVPVILVVLYNHLAVTVLRMIMMMDSSVPLSKILGFFLVHEIAV